MICNVLALCSSLGGVAALGNVQIQKISLLPPQKGLEFPGGRVLSDQKM